MQKTVIKVEGMGCAHCVATVNKAVSALNGVSSVTVDLEGKTVTVEYDSSTLQLDSIKKAIADQGYEVL